MSRYRCAAPISLVNEVLVGLEWRGLIGQQGCPETFSIAFDDSGKIKCLTVGYVADHFEGNAQGKGVAVGIFNAIGLPFLGPRPLLQLAQWFGTEVVNMGASSYSTTNMPEWWTQKSPQKASEGYLQQNHSILIVISNDDHPLKNHPSTKNTSPST